MNEGGKSDSSIVPVKPSNKDGRARPLAERVEERELAKGNSAKQTRPRTQGRTSLQSALDRVRQKAVKDKELQFTALWHHVDSIDALTAATKAINRKGSPGIDGKTWKDYQTNLELNLDDLSGRLKRGAYRAKPTRRVYIPKDDGKERPIDVPTLEDKIVQRATVGVLNAIYESDFLGFSYGFRPGRGQHNALDALTVGLKKRRVSWVLDADIRGFFEAINHEWLVKFIEHRIADPRVIRHIKKWLKAGVLENGHRTTATKGTPQGGSISPLLANIYLHYVFDLWVQQWRNRKATGEMIVVRYADDFVVGFEHRQEANEFLVELRERFRKFQLELHPDKTRLLEFGRYAAKRREDRGEGKPETFNFLGLTHICGRTRKGSFKVVRTTMAKRVRSKLKALRVLLKRRMHHRVGDVGRWLASVLRGHYRYYGVPGNWRKLNQFHNQVTRMWLWTLRRRSQRDRFTWERMTKLAKKWLPRPQITHLYPEQRLRVTTQGRSPVR